MSAQSIIAILGRRDAPTDAVEEYCRYRGERNTKNQRHKASIRSSFFFSASLVKASSEAK
jgi:hypothetical protein